MRICTILVLAAFVGVCCNRYETEVQINLPDGYTCVTPVYMNAGNAIRVRLRDGMTILEFRYKGQQKYAIFYADGGGEAYIGLKPADFHDAIDVRKGRK